MKTEIDVRTPANTEDQQTTDAKTAIPPVEFTVARGTTSNLLVIHDRQGPQNRNSTVAYRVYFLPEAFAPNAEVNKTALRAAGRKVASLVADVKAPGLGTLVSVNDTVNYGQKGYYFCVAVNRASVEAPPEHMVAAP